MEILKAYFEQERGRQSQLATSLGITRGAIAQWTKVPVERVVEVERVTGIPRRLLRPDLYETSDENRAA